MARPVIVIGAGGHGRVCLDLLRMLDTPVRGLVDADVSKKGAKLLGTEVLGGDDCITAIPPDQIHLVNGVGTASSTDLRRQVFEKFKALGFEFLTLVHPSATVSRDVVLGEGAQVIAGAVIQTGASIGSNTIINTRASIDHDCQVGNHVHVAPGAVVCGGVAIGHGSFIGAGSVLIQSIRIGEGVMVGAGSAVVADLPAKSRAVGVPAKY